MKYIILLLATSVSFAQSPWTREKGKSYLQLGFTSLNYNSYQLDGYSVDNFGKISVGGDKENRQVTLETYDKAGLKKWNFSIKKSDLKVK